MKVWKLRSMVLASLLSLVFAGSTWAESKIGYFDMAAVIEKSRTGKQAKDELQRQKDRLKADVDLKSKEFKTAKEEFDKKASVMDEAAKSKKRKELQEKLQEGEKLLMESSNQMNQLSTQLMNPIFNRVVELVKKIAKDEKYDYILERQSGGVIYGPDKADITNRVIEELDKAPPPLTVPKR